MLELVVSTEQTQFPLLLRMAAVMPNCTSRNFRPLTKISREIPSVLISHRGSKITLGASLYGVPFTVRVSCNKTCPVLPILEIYPYMKYLAYNGKRISTTKFFFHSAKEQTTL